MFTAETLDKQLEEMGAYEREHYGLPNGEDFGDIARVLMQSKKFSDLVMFTSMMGLMEIFTQSKDMSNEERMAAMRRSPLMKKALSEAFYAGYRLGVGDGQIKELNELGARDAT